jgi:hypothetical protein
MTLATTRGFALLLALALLAGVLPAGVGPAADAGAQAVSSPFGVNSHVATRYGIYQRQHVPLDVIASHNVSWVREEFRWDVIQPAPNRWDWGFSDEMVDKARQRGLNILGLLVYSVGWASPGAGAGSNQPAWTMPANLDAYRTYVTTVVGRYRGKVRAWEVWNEPNHGYFWRPAPNPAEYAALLRVAASAIRAADPGAKVVIGGVSGADIAFLEAAVAAAGWDSFDILAAHPYVAPKSPERGRLVSGEIAKLQAFVARHGGGKPIWLTEIGWPTSTPGHWGVGDPAVQANYLVRGMVMAAASPGVERVFWYNWRNDGDDPASDENNFGLVYRDWRTPKPAATALRTLTQRLDNAVFAQQLELLAGTRTVLNDFEGDQAWHAWGDGAWGSVERSGEQRHGGAASGKVRYGFTNGAKAYVDLQNIRQAPGQPRRLGLWVHGDSSGHLLWATFRDAHDEFFRVYLGALGAGWQRYEAEFDSFEYSDGDGIIQYPVRFQSLIVDNEPDGTTGEGTIYIDDLYVEDGPALYGYRFERAGRHIDVLWTAGGGAAISLPTTSASATVTNRDGQSRTVAAVAGGLPLALGEAPVFVEHVGRDMAAAPPPAPPAGGPPDPDVIAGAQFAADGFQQVWSETDQPVAEGQASRAWYWGAAPWLSRVEPYVQSPGGGRRVQYFDKSRMELTQPATGAVSNGLLVREMVAGRIQTGDLPDQFEPRAPATIMVAGDLAGANPAPIYGSFASVASLQNDNRAPNRVGQMADQRLDRAGRVTGAPAGLLGPPVELVAYDDRLGHNLPRVFWEFLHQRGLVYRDGRLQHDQLVDWVFAFGLPITEPYWIRVRVGGAERDVLVQLFERRVLTYTPGNPPGWEVEMGNVGQHYYLWRYEATPWG